MILGRKVGVDAKWQFETFLRLLLQKKKKRKVHGRDNC